MDFRLNQRLTGKIQGMKGLDDRMVEEKKTLQDRVPKPLQGIVEIPTRSYWLWNAYAYSVVAFLPILGSSFASTSLSMGFGVCLYRLYNRGAPKSSGAMDAEFRPPKRKPLLLTAGITILTAMIGGCASQVFHAVTRIKQEFCISICTAIAYWFSASFFKVQDEYN